MLKCTSQRDEYRAPGRLKCLSRKGKTIYIASVTKMSWQLVSTMLGEKRRDLGNEVVSLFEVTQE